MTSFVSDLETFLRRVISEELVKLRRALVSDIAIRNLRAPTELEYLTAVEAAALVKVQAATVRSWVDRGELAGHYAGRLLRIRADELEQFMSRKAEKLCKQDADARIREILGE